MTNQLDHVAIHTLSRLVTVAGNRAETCFMEFSQPTSVIRTRGRLTCGPLRTFWLGAAMPTSLVQPLHVAAWVELQTREHAAPTAKQRLAYDVSHSTILRLTA